MKEDVTSGYCYKIQVGRFERVRSLGKHKAWVGRYYYDLSYVNSV